MPWTPWSEWSTRIVHLELLAAAAGLLTWVERNRRHKLQLVLSKLDLDTAHLDAQNRASGDRRRTPLAQLDAVLYSYLAEVKAGPSDAELATAEANLAAAQARNEELLDGPSDTELIQISANLEKALIDLQQAQGDYDRIAYGDSVGSSPQAAAHTLAW